MNLQVRARGSPAIPFLIVLKKKKKSFSRKKEFGLDNVSHTVSNTRLSTTVHDATLRK